MMFFRGLREQNFEVEVNNKQSNKEDSERRNLNSKYLYLALVLNILIILFVLIVFNTCKV